MRALSTNHAWGQAKDPMMAMRAILVSLGAAWLSLAQGADADAPPEEERLRAEVTALFKTVLEGEQFELQDCALGSKWRRDPIPQHLAARYFGLKLHADLIAPDPLMMSPADVLYPGEDKIGQFCDRQQAADREVWLVDGFRWQPLEPSSEGRSITIKMPAREFGFPIFTDAFDRAAVLVCGSSVTYRREEDWVRMVTDHPEWCFVKIYDKVQGHWVRGAEERLFPAT
jgi:hypothetical protein